VLKGCQHGYELMASPLTSWKANANMCCLQYILIIKLVCMLLQPLRAMLAELTRCSWCCRSLLSVLHGQTYVKRSDSTSCSIRHCTCIRGDCAACMHAGRTRLCCCKGPAVQKCSAVHGAADKTAAVFCSNTSACSGGCVAFTALINLQCMPRRIILRTHACCMVLTSQWREAPCHALRPHSS
jgi:predicted outer membrane repeat protein